MLLVAVISSCGRKINIYKRYWWLIAKFGRGKGWGETLWIIGGNSKTGNFILYYFNGFVHLKKWFLYVWPFSEFLLYFMVLCFVSTCEASPNPGSKSLTQCRGCWMTINHRNKCPFLLKLECITGEVPHCFLFWQHTVHQFVTFHRISQLWFLLKKFKFLWLPLLSFPVKPWWHCCSCKQGCYFTF